LSAQPTPTWLGCLKVECLGCKSRVGMMLAPGAGALALAWLIAIYSVIAGALLIGLAIRLKKHSHA
jgi:uncharacterized membrane protein HdeD (DUF308 family)